MPNTTITPLGQPDARPLHVRLLDTPRADTHSARKDKRRVGPRPIRGPRLRDERAAERRVWVAEANDLLAA